MKSTPRLRIAVLLALIVVALVSSAWVLSHTGDWKGLPLNFGSEMADAAVTYLLLGLFIGRRERRDAEKVDLITQMGSIERSLAIGAVGELRRHAWLTDGSLREADLNRFPVEGMPVSPP